MTMAMAMTWVGPALDVAAVLLLGAVLWRLGREPGAGWAEREARLQTIFDDLRTLVAQSEGLARDLDAKLAGREERLHALLAEARAATAPAAAPQPRDERAPARASRIETRDEASAASASDGTTPASNGTAPAPNRTSAAPNRTAPAPSRTAESTALEPAALAARIETLADGGTSAEEIARQLGVAAAEVRLVIGLRAARMARRRVNAPPRQEMPAHV